MRILLHLTAFSNYTYYDRIKNHQPKYELHEVAGKKLPSEGLVMRYDPCNEYIAIGCKNGTRLIYSVDERNYSSFM